MKSAKSVVKAGAGLGQLTIWRMNVSALKPAAYNPRVALKPGMPEWASLVESVEKFGYVDPLVWNRRTGNLVGGHQRLAVLKFKGVKKVDVSVVDLDLVTEKKMNLALNKTRGAWDDAGLAKLLEELGDLGELAGTGFSEADAAALVRAEATLVESLLVPRESNEGRVMSDEEGEDGGHGEGGGAGRPRAFNLLVQCGSEKRQKALYERLSRERFACEMRTG